MSRLTRFRSPANGELSQDARDETRLITRGRTPVLRIAGSGKVKTADGMGIGWQVSGLTAGRRRTKVA
jgi:hypothetical protein